MRALRLVADQKDGPGAARGILNHFLARFEEVGIGVNDVIGGYWPIVTEIDDRPLLARLHERGVICALPVVNTRDGSLVFRRWAPLDPLEPGEHGTSHPPSSSPEVSPTVVLAPLLAVDRQGFRLGQGGGYYDRTLSAMRRQGQVTAVGVGFSVQRVEKLPRNELDQPVDWVLTEVALMRAGS